MTPGSETVAEENVSIVSAPERGRKLTISYAPRRMVMHYVSESELTEISSLGTSSVYLTFFGLAFGALVSFGTVLTTTTIESPKIYAGFVAATVVSGLATPLFAILAGMGYFKAKQKLKEIKKDAASP
jgi:hypothetical protein